jgi:hypothetical protein
VCAIKDAYSNRIVGYSIDSQMKSRIVVAALNNAVARRGDVAGCVLHTDRGSQFRSRKLVHALNRYHMVGSMGRVGAAGDNASMESFFSLLQNNVLDRRAWAHSRRAADRDRDLDRAHLPPPPSPNRARSIDPDRVRDHHDHAGRSGRINRETQSVTKSCSSPNGFGACIALTDGSERLLTVRST